MTPLQREICRSLVVYPGKPANVTSKSDFMREFPDALEGGHVALRLLEDAAATQNADDLQCALIVGFSFGFSDRQLPMLAELLAATWHFSHEDIVSALREIRTPAAVEPLFRATQ